MAFFVGVINTTFSSVNHVTFSLNHVRLLFHFTRALTGENLFTTAVSFG